MSTVPDESKRCEEINDAFDFPWPLINVIKNPFEYFGEKSDLFAPQYLFDRLLLRLAFATFLISLLSGIFFLDSYSYCAQNLCPFLIVQGSCGLIIVFIHFLALIFNWRPTNTIDYSENNRLAIKLVFLCANILTVFCIIWFFIGYFWKFQILDTHCNDNDDTILKLIGTIIIVLHYLIGAAYLWNHLWNSLSFLNYLHRIIQYRLDTNIVDDNTSSENNSTV
ncbi:hypothetical protein I4U23_000237 [Adineta vaga]|nr:hypothetical protein I4U23_000237 [Adineta vaga]